MKILWKITFLARLFDNINNLNGHTFYDFFLAKFSCLNVEMYGVVTVTGLKLSGAANSDIKWHHELAKALLCE